MQDDISGWSEWEAAFKDIPELASPSELHGLVMGIVAVAQAPTGDEWQYMLQQLDFELLDANALQLLVDEAEDAAAASVRSCRQQAGRAASASRESHSGAAPR